MDLRYALRWSWLVGIGLDRLLSEKISGADLRLRPVPKTCAREPKSRRKREPVDTQLVMQATLMLAEQNPFKAPRLDEIMRASGIYPKHPAYRHPDFVSFLKRLWLKERRIVHKQRVWREVVDVHEAAIKVVESNQPISQKAVEQAMAQPGSFASPIARNYFAWFTKRVKSGDRGVLRPKVAPPDVKAFWAIPKI